MDLLDDLQRVDVELKESHRRIRAAVAALGTGADRAVRCGPVIACYLIGFTGDIARFADRDRYAAYSGTAPVERSSGSSRAPRLRTGQPSPQLRPAHGAICQVRHRCCDGSGYFERMLAEGKTKKDAIRSLKRHLSKVAYRQLLVDAHRAEVRGSGRAPRNGSVVQRDRLTSCTPALRTKPLPGPDQQPTPPTDRPV